MQLTARCSSFTGLATSAVSGVSGLAKTALVGRQDGYRDNTYVILGILITACAPVLLIS